MSMKHQDVRESSYSHEAVLTNPWLTMGRIFWVLVAVALTVSFIALASRGSRALLAESMVEDGYAALATYISYSNYTRIILASRYFVVAIFVATGLFIFWRKSNTVIGLVSSLEVMLLPLLAGLGGQAPNYPETLNLTLASITPLIDGFLYLTWAIVSLLFVALFPSGRFPSRWFRRAALASLVLTTIFTIAAMNATDWDNSAAWPLAVMSSVVVFAAALGSAIFQYFRVSNEAERQQTRWVMASFVLVALWSMFVAGAEPFRSWDNRAAPFALFQLFGTVIVASLVPLSIASAITRYHLWEIDVVVRKTLIYALLTGTLLAIYLVSILALQRLFTAVTGQDSTLTTILSTLLIAALFMPLRRRFQDTIDRRFFRRKYDAAKVLEGFAATARDETDLDKLTAELLRVIQETMQPEHVSVWLREETSDGEHAPKVTFQGYFGEPPASVG